MLRGEERACPDCGVVTVFLPVPGDSNGNGTSDTDGRAGSGEEWVCTVCDGAISVPGPETRLLPDVAA